MQTHQTTRNDNVAEATQDTLNPLNAKRFEASEALNNNHTDAA